jgi:hypothetical protein
MARYGKKAQAKVHKVMREYKEGTLKSGKSKKPVKSRKQAIAIGLSEARKAGAKVPKKASSTSSARASKTKQAKTTYGKSVYARTGRTSKNARKQSSISRGKTAKSSRISKKRA